MLPTKKTDIIRQIMEERKAISIAYTSNFQSILFSVSSKHFINVH